MQQRNVKVRKSAGASSSAGASTSNPSSASTSNPSNISSAPQRRRRTTSGSSKRSPLEKIVFGFILVLMIIIAGSFLYQFIVLNAEKNQSNINANGNSNGNTAEYNNNGNGNGNGGSIRANVISRLDSANNKNANVNKLPDQLDDGPPHLSPPVPYLPIFQSIPNAQQLIAQTINGIPTIAGITALLQAYMAEFHDENMRLSSTQARGDEILSSFYSLVRKHLTPFDQAYRNKPIFPIRDDDSVFLSLAAFREHLLKDTMVYAFDNAKYPDKLFIGAVVQNCFGKVNPDGTIDASGIPCKTGRQVTGKNKNGNDMTKVSDAPIDMNGIEEFCTDPKYKKYCDAGQVRVVYVHETESLGPAMARYHASKLWGGETFFAQTDSHLEFAVEWDEKYRDEIKAARSYPKAVLSSYPPGFSPGAGNTVRETPGARLCFCETKVEDPNPIVRINTGRSYDGSEPRPTQIPFIAAGFFFTRAEFLVDVPFDPFLPWCFMGEEIALSMRAWTHGWDIYAPRKNLIAHQYRPGRMGLPKFWGTVGRLYGRAGMNTKLQGSVIKRIKHMVGYPDATLEKIKEGKLEFVLESLDQYGLGTTRTKEEYMKFAGLEVDEKHAALQCKRIAWCNEGALE